VPLGRPGGGCVWLAWSKETAKGLEQRERAIAKGRAFLARQGEGFLILFWGLRVKRVLCLRLAVEMALFLAWEKLAMAFTCSPRQRAILRF
jgi:hypothetical protein